MTPDRIPDRAVLRLDGPDTLAVLERTVTHTVGTSWEPGAVRFGALLTPQGKIIADWLATRTETGVLLDIHEAAVDDLAKRLKLFRLRAEMDITPEPGLAVVSRKDGDDDPRSLKLPWRLIVPADEAGPVIDRIHWTHARIVAGVPEWGEDYRAGEAFPADVNMDLIGGIDFRKGCFVGQEVVSRMKRRGVVRRRTVVVTSEDGSALSRGQNLTAGTLPIGTITSAAGAQALACIRTDRLAEAEAASEAVTCEGVALSVDKPDWLVAEMAAMSSS